MTKAKIFESVLAVCDTHNISGEALAELTKLLEPKKGGSKADVSDYTCFGEDGSVEYIFCTFHKMWEPVTGENEDGEVVDLFGSAKTPNNYARECKVGVKQWKELNKAYKDNKDAIIQDVLNEAITGEEGKAAIAELDENKNYTAAHPAELGSVERPCESNTEEA